MSVARELGVEDACEMVGRRTDVAADLAVSRVFALPSAREGVPTAVIEAMAAARPVVVTDVGHVGSVVRDGIEGFLVAPGDVEALAGRLHLLLTQPARAATMGRAARRTAKAHDVVAVAARLRSVLERAADRDGPPGGAA